MWECVLYNKIGMPKPSCEIEMHTFTQSQINRPPFSTVIPKVCSADHWWFTRLAKVVRQSLYESIYCASRATKFFKWSANWKSLGTTDLVYSDIFLDNTYSWRNEKNLSWNSLSKNPLHFCLISKIPFMSARYDDYDPYNFKQLFQRERKGKKFIR